MGVLGGVLDGLGCSSIGFGFLYPWDNIGEVQELARKSSNYNSLKHLHINYNEILSSRQVSTSLSEIIRLIREQKSLETLKFSAPKEAINNALFSAQLAGDQKEMKALTEVIRERNLKVSFEGYELLLGGQALYNFLSDSKLLPDRKVTQSYANSHSPQEIYFSTLLNFLNQLVDSELSIAVPERFYPRERSNAWWSIREDFFNLLEEVLEQVNNSPENTVNIIGDYLRIIEPYNSMFNPEPRDPEDARHVYTKDLSLGHKLSSLITEASIIEESTESHNKYGLKNEFGEEYTLNWQELQLLLEIAAVRGYVAIQESLNEILVRDFWQRNGIFTEEGGHYLGNTYVSKDVLDYIASFLHQNLHISKQRDINPSADLHFTYEQMDTLGKEIISKTPGIFRYFDAIDGTNNDSSEYIRRIINEYRNEYGIETPFIIPIEVELGNNVRHNPFGKCNHWVIYLHYGIDQGNILRRYIIDPFSEIESLHENNINRVMESINDCIPFTERLLAAIDEPDLERIKTCFQEDSYNSGVWVLYMIQKLQEQMDKRAPEIADYAPDMPHSRYMIEQVIESIREEQPNVFRLREAYENLYNRIRNQEYEAQDNILENTEDKQENPEDQECNKPDSTEEEEQTTELMPGCGLEEDWPNEETTVAIRNNQTDTTEEESLNLLNTDVDKLLASYFDS